MVNIFFVNVETNNTFGLEYLTVKEAKKTWQGARTDCQNKGYDLASVMTQDEADFLKQFA